ncbi:MAG: HNH endonuclease [Pseudomonadota bacterium]
MTSRAEFSTRTKLKAWERCTGEDGKQRCECDECGGTDNTQGLLICSKGPQYDHDLPCYLGGENSLENCRVHRHGCHQRKTSDIDQPRITKTRHVTAGHANAKTTRNPLPGGKKSGKKKTVDGRVICRETGRQLWPR